MALQGGFEVHAIRLRSLGHSVLEVRNAGDLAQVDGLVLPGGESTAQWQLLQAANLVAPVRAFVAAGRPLLATCAGMILAAQRVTDAAGTERPSLSLIDIDVIRNAYGRQLDSFEGRDDDDQYDLVFIRAPRISRIGPGVTVLARLRGEPILVRRGSTVAMAFHPELTDDLSLHALTFTTRA
jgi:5'-phosphate synthase pdxT subunit